MPPILVPTGTVLRRNPEESISYQLYDTCKDYLPAPIETRLRELNMSQPLKGLFAQINEGEITKGQWVLYTHICFVGQIVNGGVEQFIDNCPGLIVDAAKMLSEFGDRDLAEAYSKAVEGFTAAIERHAATNDEATGEALAGFWSEMEGAWRDDDQDRFNALETACYAHDRESDTSNWFTQLEQRVLNWVLENPAEFIAKS